MEKEENEKGYKELKDMPIDRFLIEYNSKNKLKEDLKKHKCKCEEIRKNQEEETVRDSIIYMIVYGIFTFWFLGFVMGYFISYLL